MSGDTRAIVLLDQHYLAKLPTLLKLPADQLDEVCQKVRIHLLIPSPRPSPELEFGRRRDRFAFNQCLRASFDALAEEHQDLLRMHYLEGISTTALAVVFKVNQSTISRRIKDVRREFYEKTKQCLQEKLGLTSEEFRSLLSSIRSQLEFGEDPSGDEGEEDPPPEA